MNEIELRLLFLFIGLIIGYVLGMMKVMSDNTKRIKENTEYCRKVIQKSIDDSELAHQETEQTGKPS